MSYDNQRKPGVDPGVWKLMAWVVIGYVVAGGLYIALKLWG